LLCIDEAIEATKEKWWEAENKSRCDVRLGDVSIAAPSRGAMMTGEGHFNCFRAAFLLPLLLLQWNGWIVGRRFLLRAGAAP
jgi:hypothetical protein